MILCCGEALIDMLPVETAAGRPAMEAFPGGSVFNTAIALGRLESETGFFSGISTDFFGRILLDSLTASGVDASNSVISDRPTTLAFVNLADGQATFTFYDENTAGRMLCPVDLPSLPEDISALFFGGISLVVEPCGSAYQELMEQQAKTHTIMLDPNIRPKFIIDEPTYRARIKRLFAISDIVKLSDEDVAWLKEGCDPHIFAVELLDLGPKLVCVTEGERGVHAYTRNCIVHVESPQVTIADTVGAGDTFNAGLLSALGSSGALAKSSIPELDEVTIRKALTFGTRAAAVTVSRAGANPPWRHEL